MGVPITRNAIIDYYRKSDDGVEATSELPDILAEENGNEEIESEVAAWLRPMMEELSSELPEWLAGAYRSRISNLEKCARVGMITVGRAVSC